LAGYGITDAVPASRAVNTTAPLTGGGALNADRTLGIQDATTAQKGAVQLTDSVSSTSTTTAATPNSVKAAYDLASSANAAANAALPKAGGTMTGIIAFAAGQTIDKADGLTGVTDLRVGSVAVGARYGSGAYSIYGTTFDSSNPFLLYELLTPLMWDAPAGTWKSLGLVDLAPYGSGQLAVRIA
jgi:phage-related tail fiber protein